MLRSLVSRANSVHSKAIAPLPSQLTTLKAANSRILARRLHTSLAPLSGQPQRSHVPIPIYNSSTPSGDSSKPTSISSIIADNGGWYALVGLGGFLAVSKEILILNEELLMVTNFAAMIFISYLAVGDSLVEMVETEKADMRKRNDEISDLYIDGIKMAIKSHELNIAQVDVLKSLKEEYSTLVSSVTKLKEIKARQAARDAVLARLSSVKQRETTEADEYTEAVYTQIIRHLQDSWLNADGLTRARVVDHAIDIISGKEQEISDDPLEKIYRGYVDNKQYDVDIRQAREAQRRLKQQRLARA